MGDKRNIVKKVTPFDFDISFFPKVFTFKVKKCQKTQLRRHFAKLTSINSTKPISKMTKDQHKIPASRESAKVKLPICCKKAKPMKLRKFFWPQHLWEAKIKLTKMP